MSSACKPRAGRHQRERNVERTQAFRDQPAARARGYRGSVHGRLRNVGVVKSIRE